MAPLPLSQLCGQLIIGGFEGDTLPADMAGAVSQGRRGGVILFARNAKSVEAVLEINTAVLAAGSPASLAPLVGVDQEGGRVQRLGEPVLQLPPMRQLGAVGDAALVERAALQLGRELAALGFNVDFAPVLDVDSNPANPVIGDRAFGADPELVARLGAAFARGLQRAGILACGKHFPGHGDTAQDSHLELPHVRHDRARLDEIELRPFQEASGDLGAIMSAHVVYPAIDPHQPATFSHAALVELLRGELAFEGVVFSDDLEMRAVADRWSIEECAVRAVRAGCDALLICRSFDMAERAHGALVMEAERDAAFRERCVSAAERLLAVRRRFPARASSAAALRTILGSEERGTVLRLLERRSGRG